MPKFILRLKVMNNSGVPVFAHVGASLVGTQNHIEYYNASEDIKRLFPVGETTVQRYLSTDLGTHQKYFFLVNILFAPFVSLFCMSFYFVIIYYIFFISLQKMMQG